MNSTRSNPRPAAEPIPLCVPEIRGNEARYLQDCLDTTFVSSVGPFVDRFEREVAARVGARFGVATNTGTAALHVALLVAGVQPDDEVLVSTLTFIAPANAIRYVGARPVFMDAEPRWWQMDPAKVKDFLERECYWRRSALYNRRTGRRVRALLPVHVLGHPVELDPLLELARRFELPVIEDATECLGARYQGRPAGHLGDIGCFSFNGNKIITAGGGGLIVTDREDWAQRAKYLTTQAKDDPVEFVHRAVGYNYRLTNLQAAMGCAQLEQLDDYIAAKRRIAAAYTAQLQDFAGLEPMGEAPWAESIFWMFTLLVDAARFGSDSRALLRRFDAARIQTRPLWQPLHCSAAHAPAQAYHCEVAERIHRDSLSLPCSVGLTPAQQERVLAVVAAAARPAAPPSNLVAWPQPEPATAPWQIAN